MAIIKLKSGTFQARLQGRDGKLRTKGFPTRLAAEQQLLTWKKQKKEGRLESNFEGRITLDSFFNEWFEDVSNESVQKNQSGWRKCQHQYYKDYIGPCIGRYRLQDITPQMIKRVLIEMAKRDKAAGSQVLVYSTMKKMFGDAVENYQYLTFNPVLRKLKPTLAVKEARHFNMEQSIRLLKHVDGKKYGLAIWIQLFLGLRVGELIALQWEDVDLETRRISIRRAYLKHTESIRDYPKGGKHHSHTSPFELYEKLKTAKLTATSSFVAPSPLGNKIGYGYYLYALKMYCLEIGLPHVGTHGLRHSTSELYMHHGATRDDLRRLFAHSSSSVTDRYIHNQGGNLDRIADTIRLLD